MHLGVHLGVVFPRHVHTLPGLCIPVLFLLLLRFRFAPRRDGVILKHYIPFLRHFAYLFSEAVHLAVKDLFYNIVIHAQPVPYNYDYYYYSY